MRNPKVLHLAISFLCGIFFDRYILAGSTPVEDVPNYSEASEEAIIETQISIDGDSFELGLRKGEETFFPWRWIKHYFDVYGEFNPNTRQFNFRNSYSNTTYLGDVPYSSTSAFMNFGNYNVETRDRVKVLCGRSGVPISTQWSIDGYYYPIQIAQFGLSAYSKNKTDKEPQIIQELKPKPVVACSLLSPSSSGFSFNGSGCEVDLSHVKAEKNKNLQICFEKLSSASKIIVEVKALFGVSSIRTVHIEYISGGIDEVAQIFYTAAGNVIQIGVGNRETEASCITRQINVDLLKGLGYRARKTIKKVKAKLKSLVAVRFVGSGIVSSLNVANKRYETHFQNAAKWLKDAQSPDGRWPIEVEKELDGYNKLSSGWSSAMAQGHGISMMVRAAQVTGDDSYWAAASAALTPYKTSTSGGGVANKFMGQAVWFEEYPFPEGHFVLNGFMYALIGLYDLSSARDAPADLGNEARRLFQTGMTSLKTLLPLYDAGKGSFYDLTHFVKQRAPNLARWDYHTVHIQQLRLLNSFLHDEMLSEFATRWNGYLKGDYADHN